jgi:hypothetical protein
MKLFEFIDAISQTCNYILLDNEECLLLIQVLLLTATINWKLE